ncbi:MAG: alkaline ceramidase [Nocardioides sp.]|nr:alkaline ceramidase [Nocardioides sp.]
MSERRTAARASASARVTTAAPDAADRRSRYRVGRGIADITGEVADAGMLGYADTAQVSAGLHQRQRARAFVVVDRRTGEQVVHVTAELPLMFQSVRDAVLTRLERRYGDLYGERNVMITVTHTHSGPGGYAHHNLYNVTTYGFHPRTFRAAVDGIVASVVHAHADLAPSTLRTARARLAHASAQRSRTSFDRNPAADKAYFPSGTDTASTTLEVLRGGDLAGLVNWFPVHATSMTTQNLLVSPDNKGYAAWSTEHDLGDVNHLTESDDPGLVAAYAQTNAGDMSPNLRLEPGTGPTRNEFTNTRVIGERMRGAVQRALRGGGSRRVRGAVDSRLVYVDMSAQRVSGRFTPDGTPQRTCEAAFGAAFAAGSTEDGGGGLPVFHEGADGGNPLFDVVSDALYTASPELEECHGDKEILFPAGSVDFVQQRLPVQLVRIGQLYLVGIPAEVTIVSGLRLRRTVAAAVGTDVENVLVQGYANAYAHYVVTPEEYEVQNYEGASTLFGQYELPALQQVAHRLGRAMRRGEPVALGTKERDRGSEQVTSTQGQVLVDTPLRGTAFGDVVRQPAASYPVGRAVQMVFSGAHPNNDLRHGGTYVVVERWTGSRWRRCADDGDWSTRMTWTRVGASGSRIGVRWAPDRSTPTGRYRIRYQGTARDAAGETSEIVGRTRVFRLT